MSISFEVIRKIDKSGRIVIPSDIKKTYGIMPNDNLIIKATDEGIYITKKDTNN